MRQQLWMALPLVMFLIGSVFWHLSPVARHWVTNAELVSAIKNRDEMASLTALKAGADPNIHVHGTAPASLWSHIVHPSTAENQDQEWGTYWQPALAPVLDWGNDKVIQALLKNGANVNERDSGGHGLLSAAVFTKRHDLVNLILDKGADDGCKAEALMTAITVGDKALVQKLIVHGANVNSCDDNGSTPLMEAVSFQHWSIAQVLIDYGADVNRRDKQGGSALSCILSWTLYGSGGHTVRSNTDRTKIVQTLVSAGASVSVRDFQTIWVASWLPFLPELSWSPYLIYFPSPV